MATQRHPEQPDLSDLYEPPRRVSYDDYVRLEDALPGRYEYNRGLMYPRYYPPGSHRAMSGGTVAHNDLIVNLITLLHAYLRSRGPCRVYTSDMRLRAGEGSFFPDVYVSCGETQPRPAALEDAVHICEVRSQSTAEYDRDEKFRAYQQLPGLRDYLIVDNRRPQVTLLSRADDGAWRYLVLAGGATLSCSSIDLAVPVAMLYDGVELDVDQQDERPDN